MRAAAVRAVVGPSPDGWTGRIPRRGIVVTAPTRERCMAALRRSVGAGTVLTVEVTPRLAGVAEAAAILGWDRRRVITYVDRGAFPEPVAHLASGRVWRREDIEDYARERARRSAERRRP